MFTTPETMRIAGHLARHSAARLAVAAENTANADTPGYRTRDIETFSAHVGHDRISLNASRQGHLTTERQATAFPLHAAGGEQSMNGNDVDLEAELVRSTEARSGHNLALAVYGASLDILRSAIGRGR